MTNLNHTDTSRSGDLVKRLRKARVWPDYSQSRVTIETAHEAADRIEALEAENERLREALEAYAAHCSICSGGGSIVEEDSATGALLWRDCPGCTPALAALAGDSHDQ